MRITLSQLNGEGGREDVVELERESAPYSGLNLPHDREFEERDEDPVDDALVQEAGREKPHPLLWAESRG